MSEVLIAYLGDYNIFRNLFQSVNETCCQRCPGPALLTVNTLGTHSNINCKFYFLFSK